jgi:hypothetical protein
MSHDDFRIRAETEAAKALLTALRADGLDDDPDIIADAVEGETSLLEAIDEALAEIDEVESLITGLKDKEGQYYRRRKTLEERIVRLRALIEQAMAVTSTSTLRRPAATLTLKNLPPQVIVTAEADIPSEFFVPQPPPPPKLDLKALKAALLAHAGEGVTPAIPGALLSNGSQSLQIRRA